MYESPAYGDLKKVVEHWAAIKSSVDLARKFRHMTYGGQVTLASDPGPHSIAGAGETVLLGGGFGKEILEWAAKRCDERAAELISSTLPAIDIAAAAKV